MVNIGSYGAVLNKNTLIFHRQQIVVFGTKCIYSFLYYCIVTLTIQRFWNKNAFKNK